MSDVRLTPEEAETLVTCEGCGVHLQMRAALPEDEGPAYSCARCVWAFVEHEMRVSDD